MSSLSCDKSSVNSSSQTAYDVARFWGHRHIAHLLNDAKDDRQRLLLEDDGGERENYFSRETLDRVSGRRTDGVWLEDRRRDPCSVFLLFSSLSPMVSSAEVRVPWSPHE